MLKLCQKGRYDRAQTLTAEEDRALRLAFGRFAAPKARAGGAAVVRRYQHEGPGNWFFCDCLGEGARPPALVPVLECFIRRHNGPPWPPHAEGCDFARDPVEQQLVTASYAPPAAGRARLIRGFADESADRETQPPERHGYARRREALATLLLQLVDDAGLMTLAAGMAVPKLGEQFRAIRSAARRIEIDRGQRLAPFLCTYLPALPELIARIDTAPPERFPGTRPHGLLIAVVTGMARGTLVVDTQNRLPVRGRIAVFGERDGHNRDTEAPQADRAPYLVICLVGRPGRDEAVQILRAYAHPCVGPRHLMLVDSDLERRTLHQLRKVQHWLGKRLGITVDIEKPCFDIAGAPHDGTTSAVREPCIPDFILRARGVASGGARTVIVETMGYDDERYRTRKQIMHRRMSAGLGGAPVIEHDFHLPVESDQDGRDRYFWRRVRWVVSGSGASARGDNPVAAGATGTER